MPTHHRPLTSPNQTRLPCNWLLQCRVHACWIVAVLHLLTQRFGRIYALSPGLLPTRLCCLLAESTKKGLSIGRNAHPGICYFILYHRQAFVSVRDMRSMQLDIIPILLGQLQACIKGFKRLKSGPFANNKDKCGVPLPHM